jgi:2-polyprenyl-6-methoxyphenol hydroxylase-like FAD-dependent oxidoreductase
MSPVRNVLISGASIAGPTLAYWLHRAGFRPVIVERAPAPRPGGQAIDVRGPALEVLDRMGLLDAVKALRTRMKGFATLDAEGNELWRTEEITFTAGSIHNDDIELLRDDLSATLASALPPDIEIIYGDSIAALDDGGGRVTVSFEKCGTRDFDLVIGADGIGSGVRALVFGEERQFLVPFNFAMAIYSAPNHIGLQDWQVSCRDGEKNCLVYTVRGNRELRLCYGFPAGLSDEHRFDLQAQKELVAAKAEGLGWEVPRLLEAMWTAPDFWLGIAAQVKMPAWSKGRVALVGDAAYCPSPFTGQGTSLAIIGAYVLAQEIARHPSNHAAAFERYEARMRPFVDKNQAIAILAQDKSFSEEGGQERVLNALEEAKNAIELDAA